MTKHPPYQLSDAFSSTASTTDPRAYNRARDEPIDDPQAVLVLIARMPLSRPPTRKAREGHHPESRHSTRFAETHQRAK
jgi:hypothetical protein